MKGEFLKHYNGALDDLNKAIELDSKDSEKYYARAVIIILYFRNIVYNILIILYN